MKLNLRNKRKKRLPARVKEPLLRPVYPNVTWSMDFMHDTLECGKKVRSLNIMDDFNREILQVSIDSSLPSAKVISSLEQLTQWRGKAEKIRVDNGPEFIAQKMKDWRNFQGIELQFIQPGKPTQNSLIERFNRTFRSEFLDVYLFKNIKQMRNYAEIWMWKYNNERPPQRTAIYDSTRLFIEIWKNRLRQRSGFWLRRIIISHIPTKFQQQQQQKVNKTFYF